MSALIYGIPFALLDGVDLDGGIDGEDFSEATVRVSPRTAADITASITAAKIRDERIILALENLAELQRITNAYLAGSGYTLDEVC